MRLSGFVVAAVLLVSVTVLAQHSSGGGGSSSAGHSGGSSSASYSSSGSLHGNSGSSHLNSTGTSGSVRNSGTANDHAQSSNVKPEKKHAFSSLRHKNPAPKSAFLPPVRCKKGQICTCPGGGTPNAVGKCIPATLASCPVGQVWNGFACGQQYWWFNDCRALADQLAAQERHMRGLNDPGQVLIYRLLKSQYEQCLRRFGLAPFNPYTFSDASLLDIP